MRHLFYQLVAVATLLFLFSASHKTEAVSLAPINIAFTYLNTVASEWGLDAEDIDNAIIQQSYHAPHNQTYHLVLQQTKNQIPIVGAELLLHFNQKNELISLDNRFIPHLSTQHPPTQPKIPITEIETNAKRVASLPPPLSAKAPKPSLVYLPIKNQLTLSWMIQRVSTNQQHYWNQYWDAISGQLLHQEDWIQYEGPTYHVYPLPVESPNHGERTIQTAEQSTASPYGWHDINGTQGAEYTHTQGNNVHAYADTNGDQLPDGLPGSEAQPDGGVTLHFDFPINLSQPPNNYKKAAVTQLFYQTNILHDLFYLYGFNERNGNFQQNNYGRGGWGNDPILAEAEDAGRWNNASFMTPPDGQPGRMQMHWWNRTTPWRVSEFDNTITIHEFGHGVSTRMTGGSRNVSCLFNEEQMGEGWSDWWAAILTTPIETISDNGATPHGIGTYVLGQPPTGNGIRPAPYSTDISINHYTYQHLAQLSPPHGTGFIWATILWDLHWALVEKHGWESNWFNKNEHAGNIIAFQLILDGLTLQPCYPGFVDGRDAILLADLLNNQGENQCLLWERFARRGLGYGADQGSSDQLGDETISFDTHPDCGTLSISPKEQTVCAGEAAPFQINGGIALDTPVYLQLQNPPAALPYSLTPNPMLNLPSATTLTFYPPPFNPTATIPIQLSISNNQQISVTALLTIEHTIPHPIQLLTPLSGTIHHSITPHFSWSADPTAHAYRLQLATDYDFEQIAFEQELNENSYSFIEPLLANRFYYWRVVAHNSCGERTSPTAVFLSPNSERLTRTSELEIGSRVFIISDPLYISRTTPIKDMNLWIDMEHQYVGDLIIRLSHIPTGEMIDLINQPGVPESRFGCASDNLSLVLDDQATEFAEEQCAYPYPAIFGSLRPDESLSTFNIDNPAGYWRITIWDMYDEASEGILHKWGFDLTTDSASADYSDLPLSYGIARHLETVDQLQLGGSWTADERFAQFTDQNDGIRFKVNKKKISLFVSVVGNGRLACWFDWNNNQRFEQSEQTIDQRLPSGTHKIRINTPSQHPHLLSVRCRLFPTNHNQIDPFGDSNGGEVEDYQLLLPDFKKNQVKNLTIPIQRIR